ncbi:MAG TPA: IS110 family transposase [Tepidisphaeraceae bacterium]|jgi:transposase|nr:IS110 family transposase [Tepidisphaeraceae bacterium]
MYTVGLDVGQNCSSVEILDEHGKHFKHLEIKDRWEGVVRQIQKHTPTPFKVCFEASCGYGPLHDRLSTMASGVQVAHPGHLRLIFRSKKKHNRVDAQKLAKLLFLDEVPRAYVPPAEVRSWRAMIEHRQKLLQTRVSIKRPASGFPVRSLLKGLGIHAERRLWTKKGMSWLKALDLPESEALRRDIMVVELQDVNKLIGRVQKHLKKVSDRQPAVALLMTIPGVGIRTAETFVAYVHDIRRFTRIKCVGSYFGLIPCQDASGNVNRLGHITKEGPSTVRKMLTEAAWQGIRRSPTIRGFYQQVKRDDPKRNKIALIATAHYLTRVMAAMLRSGECWREKDPPEQKQSEPNQRPGQSRSTGTDGCAAPLRKTPEP